MLRTFKTNMNKQFTALLFSFALAALPFIILSFFIVSNAREADGTQIAASAAETEAHPMSLARRAEGMLPERKHIGYDRSVVAALKAMALVPDHFDAWLVEHPESALAHIKYMPRHMQRDIASTALFIRKSNGRIDPKTAWREAAALVHYSAKYGVPNVLTTAVAHTESTFDPDALSPKGAAGVMQVMWRLHRGLLESNGIRDASGANPLFDPEKAVAAGCLLLSRYIRAYGSVQAAMERYYGGSSTAYQRKVNRNIARIVTHRSQFAD